MILCLVSAATVNDTVWRISHFAFMCEAFSEYKLCGPHPQLVVYPWHLLSQCVLMDLSLPVFQSLL